MENSEQLEKIIDLGKLLVKELDLEPGVDTLARWMAHYIAEKIHQVEVLPPGAERAQAEKECYDTILKIWDHRSQLPRGRRPFQNYEPILKVLESIDPDNFEPFLHRMSEYELTQLATNNPNYETIRPYIESVLEIEKIARVWMESLLNQAALKVTDEKTKAWLEAASLIGLPDDIHSIRIVYKGFNLLDSDDDTSSKDIDRIEKRVKQLEKFGKLNDQLLKMYQEELANRQAQKPE